MKKLIGTAMLAALLATSAFAEVSFGAWLNNLFTPVAYNGKDVVVGVNNPWGGWRPSRIGFNYTSDDEKLGIILGVAIDDGKLGTFTPNYMWAKPWDWLRVSVGHYSDNDTGLRSDLTYGSWTWLRPGNAVEWGEGITFDDTDGAGVRLQLFPVEGLHIAAIIPYSSTFTKAEDVYKNMQVAAGYTIADIGTIKVQWKGLSKSAVKTADGKWKDKDGQDVATDKMDISDPTDYYDALNAGYTYTPAVEAKSSSVENKFGIAFDLTAIDGMFLTVGAKLTITDDSDTNNYVVALGWRYNVADALTLFADASVKLFGNSDNDPNVGAAVGINYAFADALNLDAEVRWLHKGATKTTKSDDGISFLVGLNYNFSSNGLLGVGFQGHYKGGLAGLKAEDDFVWAVPIKLSVWF